MRVKSVNAISDLLIRFRKDCNRYYNNLRSRDPITLPLPSVVQFKPQFQRFAQAILDDEKARHEKVVEQERKFRAN